MPKFPKPFELHEDFEIHNNHCRVLFSLLGYLEDVRSNFPHNKVVRVKGDIYMFFILGNEFCGWTYIHKTYYVFVIYKDSWPLEYLEMFMGMWNPQVEGRLNRHATLYISPGIND